MKVAWKTDSLLGFCHVAFGNQPLGSTRILLETITYPITAKRTLTFESMIFSFSRLVGYLSRLEGSDSFSNFFLWFFSQHHGFVNKRKVQKLKPQPKKGTGVWGGQKLRQKPLQNSEVSHVLLDFRTSIKAQWILECLKSTEGPMVSYGFLWFIWFFWADWASRNLWRFL